MKTPHHLPRTVATLLLLGLLPVACAHTDSSRVSSNLPAPKPGRVDFENLTARTTSVDSNPTLTSDDLLARIQLLRRESNASARILHLVQRFPDAALEGLRGMTAAQAAQDDWLALAAAYDQAFVAAGSSSWTATLIDAAAHPQPYDALAAARRQALRYIEMGRPEGVFKDTAVAQASAASFAGAEFLRVRGIAAILCDRPADALAAWRSAAALAAPDRSVTAELSLLTAEGLRRTGQPADAPWSAAATAAATVHDPILWQRLLDERTDSMTWPPAVTQAFANNTNVDAAIWQQMGEWRLARGAAPSALLAFKQAQALFTQPRDQAQSRIAQARALLILNQSGAAVSILTALAVDHDPQISHHALAVLADARLANDDVAGALTLLCRAVADDDAFPPALRAPARADLGLVLLMSAQESQGLTWLHRAQADFSQAGDNAGLFQCLHNEADYLAKAGRVQEAQAISQRAAQVAALP